MTNDVKISIVTPCYNSAKTIRDFSALLMTQFDIALVSSFMPVSLNVLAVLFVETTG